MIVEYADKKQSYKLEFPDDATEEEIRLTIDKTFPYQPEEKKEDGISEESSSLFKMAGFTGIGGFSKDEQLKLAVSPVNVLKGAANILMSAPKNIVGVPLEAVGERMASLRTDEENWSRVMNDELAFGDRLTALLEYSDMHPFTRAAVKNIAEFTPVDEAIVSAGKKITDITDNMIDSIGFKRPEGQIEGTAFDIGSGFGSLAMSLGLSSLGMSHASIGALFGIMGASDTYKKAQYNGVDTATAFNGATISGAFQGILEMFGLDIFTARMKGVSDLTRGIARTATNIADEILQGAAAISTEKLFGIESLTLKEIIKELSYTGLISFVTGAPASAVFTHLENKGVTGILRAQGMSDEEIGTFQQEVSNRVLEKNKNLVISEISKMTDELSNSKEVAKMRQSFDEEVLRETAITSPQYETITETQKIVEDYIKESKLSTKVKNEAKVIAESVSKEIDKTIRPISARLMEIDEEIGIRTRKYEFDTKARIFDWSDRVKPFINKFRSMPIEDRAQFDLALKNSKMSTILPMLEKYNMAEEYKQVKILMDEIFKKAKDVGINIGYRDNFFTRKVKAGKLNEYKDFLRKSPNWSAIEEAIAGLSETEQADAINSMLRGFAINNNVILSKPGQFKSRLTEEVGSDTFKFYEDSDNALIDYIISAADFISAKEFFGKETGTVDESRGALVKKLVEEKKLNNKQEQELREILSARFNQRGPNTFINALKNVEYAATLGQVYSTLTQIGDIYPAIYKNGLKNAIIEYGKAIFGMSDIKMSDIKLDSIAEELSSRTLSANAVSSIFKYGSGLTFIDKVGKEAFINSAMKKTQQLLAKNDKETLDKIEMMFKGDAEQAKNDIIAGKKTDLSMFFLFNELSDFQPISLSEVPENYLRGGNWRVVYMLRTFGLKQFETFRREIFSNLASSNNKDKIKGAQNLFRLTMIMLATNVPIDMLKDLLKGNDVSLSESIVETLLGLVFMSRYNLNKIQRGDALSAIFLTFPTNVASRILSDVTKAATGDIYGIEDIQSTRNIPVIGEWIYRTLNN